MKKYHLGHLVFCCVCCICSTVLFMRNDAPRVYFTPGPDCENAIILEISRANTIDIAVYSITNTNIANAIIDAHSQGAQIRIITDHVQSHGKQSLVKKLRQVGIQIRTNRGYKIEHNKFAIFDNTRVITGSYNWTIGATKYNSENCIILSAPEYRPRFEVLWQKYDTQHT